MTHNGTLPRFFIVGTGRCGTTLLRKLLVQHPDVYIPQETHWLPILANYFGMQRVPHTEIFRVVENTYMAKGKTALERILKENALEPEDFRQDLFSRFGASAGTVPDFMAVFYGLLAERNGASICGDKTPDYGFCMTMLQQFWPQAKFIHIFRDGRDVALSMSKVLSFRYLVAWEINHWFGIAYKKQYEQKQALVVRSPAPSKSWFAHWRKPIPLQQPELPLERFYELWRSRLLRIRDEAHRLSRDCYQEIRYADLLSNPIPLLRHISQFLNLPERGNWMKEASTMINAENVQKNLDTPDYVRLTSQYASDLTALGFEP
ncbi:hypothetical protein GF339_12725 [candidate division KSB3 bacterium]|uniref:Sulfotransferase n=1 Tax=candidate division KSB3 bacterium TaxID=2044937 RepID=A0A9D5JX06_9BACT|nr:hypothetical protein [candidate division KSB3 bacterium]MBD3325447.1 hypothetical protein [candidate division KSB3 bacterium]